MTIYNDCENLNILKLEGMSKNLPRGMYCCRIDSNTLTKQFNCEGCERYKKSERVGSGI